VKRKGVFSSSMAWKKKIAQKVTLGQEERTDIAWFPLPRKKKDEGEGQSGKGEKADKLVRKIFFKPKAKKEVFSLGLTGKTGEDISWVHHRGKVHLSASTGRELRKFRWGVISRDGPGIPGTLTEKERKGARQIRVTSRRSTKQRGWK